MTSARKRNCKCKIDGKQYNEFDETCIKCVRSQEMLELLFDVAIERALKHGDMSLVRAIIEREAEE